MKRKQTEVWLIKTPDGYFAVHHPAFSKEKCISGFLEWCRFRRCVWSELSKNGYRCVKVKLVEAKPKKRAKK